MLKKNSEKFKVNYVVRLESAQTLFCTVTESSILKVTLNTVWISAVNYLIMSHYVTFGVKGSIPGGDEFNPPAA